MDVYLCGQPNAARQSVANHLVRQGFEVLRPQDGGFRRSPRARVAWETMPCASNSPEHIRFVLGDGDSYRRATHPNLTVVFRSTIQTAPAPRPRPIVPDDTVEREAGNHRNGTQAVSPNRAMRDSYVPKHDLMIDLAVVGPIDAARTIIEEARAFWSDCNLGTIGPFREDHFFLSNMFPTRVIYDGLAYACSESAYQAQKTDDIAVKKQVSQLDGKSAKKFMDHVPPKSGWGSECVPMMERVLLAKFTQNDELRRKLASTEGFYLCELNHWDDDFFGVPMLPDGTIGYGLNMLGKALMRVRRDLCRVARACTALSVSNDCLSTDKR